MERWGVLDTQDNCWLGDDSGPKVFDSLSLARVAAQLYEMQVLGTDLAGRFQAREYQCQNPRKKDEIPTKMGTMNALRRIEGQ